MSVLDELEDLNERLEDNLAQIRSHATKAMKTEDDATALRVRIFILLIDPPEN